MGLIANLPKFWDLFKEGEALSNAAAWKNKLVAVNGVVAFIATALLIAKAYGFDLELDDDTIHGLAGGVVALVGAVNAVMHVVANKDVGLSSNGGTASGN